MLVWNIMCWCMPLSHTHSRHLYLGWRKCSIRFNSDCGSADKESTCNVGDLGLIPGLGISPGEGKGYPLQYSGLENLMDSIVHGAQRVRHDWATFTHFTIADIWLITKYFFLMNPNVASESFLTDLQEAINCSWRAIKMKFLANSDLINISYLFILPLVLQAFNGKPSLSYERL